MNVLVTGGAGYIGSTLVAHLLARGDRVTVVDDLWFGGECLLPFLGNANFRLARRDLRHEGALNGLTSGVDAVVHLAGLVGFPACDKAGRELTWAHNVLATEAVHAAACTAGIARLVFASSYSNYGRAEGDSPLDEQAQLAPQSLYAESKIAAERYLLASSATSPASVCLRLATVFGLGPRTRFDLMVNQFSLDAYRTGRLVIYQEDFRRSFVHVRDVAAAIACVLAAPVERIRGQIFNVGSERLNITKGALVAMLTARWPGLEVEYRAASFAQDLRSVHIAVRKMREELGFEGTIGLDEGIRELHWALTSGVIPDPDSARYRNHPPILV